MSGARLSGTLGTLRFYQQQGQSYADMLRGTFTASTFVTAVAFYLGMGQRGAVLLGAASMVFWVALSIVLGWAVVRWHVYRAQQTNALQADPIASEQMELLREQTHLLRVLKKQIRVTIPPGAPDDWEPEYMRWPR